MKLRRILLSPHCAPPTHYLAAGSRGGPLLVFVHGWPGLSLSWRHQLPVFAGLGVAGDRPGPARRRIIVALGGTLGLCARRGSRRDAGPARRARAAIDGVDWARLGLCHAVESGPLAPPARCPGVATLCVPYFGLKHGLAGLLPLVDRGLYRVADYPYGQWDYRPFYGREFCARDRRFQRRSVLKRETLVAQGRPLRGRNTRSYRRRAARWRLGWAAGRRAKFAARRGRGERGGPAGLRAGPAAQWFLRAGSRLHERRCERDRGNGRARGAVAAGVISPRTLRRRV